MAKVSHIQILERGLTQKCPNCGEKSIFETTFKLHENCPNCSLAFERGEGFFLGSMSINYSFTIIFCLIPVALLWYFKIISGLFAAIFALIGALFFPVIFYRCSRSLWLMFYFLVLPHELPLNKK